MDLLHGTLYCTIHNAENLINEFHFEGTASAPFRRMVGKVENAVRVGRGPSRLYATVQLGKETVRTTKVIEGEPVNPSWNESFEFYCAHTAADVVITIRDDDLVGSHELGHAKMKVRPDLLQGNVNQSWLDLYQKDGNLVTGGGRVRVSIQFQGVRKDEQAGTAVEPAYFGQRQGCDVRLYQDAHMVEGFMPDIELSGGQLMESRTCWEDIFAAILDAQFFVYIAGWSVFTQLELRRSVGTETLGELLKRKAQTGVVVLLLVWDDRTSIKRSAIKGIMRTQDEDTFKYFRNTAVICRRSARSTNDRNLKGVGRSVMFSHHQKFVCCDAAAPAATNHSNKPSRRLVVSFIGGIDLCDGRYDDQRHSLFRTLESEHAKDFYQRCFKKSAVNTGGPREPWHDVHCRIRGPAAWDVLKNFEQRWRKQGSDRPLLDLDSHPGMLPSSTAVLPENSTDLWNVQVFRSIDSGAAFGFPDNPADTNKMGLGNRKDSVFERSIQDAYIHAIRRAKHFIYIENQYFLGSCHFWDTNKDAGNCYHLIPIEIALKIESKIKADEPFVVYIVVPMWPEGRPESWLVQKILAFQQRTMEMMYKRVASALYAAGKTEEQLTDYLTFFCLGNREARHSDEPIPKKKISDDSLHYKAAQKNRRFMIYVHSKLMIVDDEYIILGSANINQRSMDGRRDTEIAIGACQPFQSVDNSPSRGQVYGFRMSLWYEHLGHHSDAFFEPQSLECVRHVNKAAKDMWDLYTDENNLDLPGHLLAYPIDVSQEGNVSEIWGKPFFPDTRARILGKQKSFLSEKLMGGFLYL